MMKQHKYDEELPIVTLNKITPNITVYQLTS